MFGRVGLGVLGKAVQRGHEVGLHVGVTEPTKTLKTLVDRVSWNRVVFLCVLMWCKLDSTVKKVRHWTW